MKTIHKIFLPALALLFSACNEDFLTLAPEDTLSPVTYFSTETELRLWTNSFYTLLEEADAEAAMNADDNIDNALGDIMEGQRDAASEGGWTWSMLRRINYYLQHSFNCSDVSARNHYDGVAYFMRAYFYFEKVRRYGDVPWYNQVLGSADDKLLYKARDNRELVMDSVMADLDKAIALLPTAKSTVYVTKWTALAFKTRAALYEGTYRKYHNLGNADKYLEQVATAGNDFIKNSGYSLYSTGTEPYRNLFNSADAISSEVILTRIYSSTANLMNGIQFNINNMRQSFSREFMNHYLMADGSRFSEQAGWQTMLYAKETQNRDPRMKQTVLCPGYIQKGASAATKNTLKSLTGYQCIKFIAESAYDGASKGISDWPLFRAAEVYLNYAEAKAELGTLTQDDIKVSINKIRTRAKMPDMVLTTAKENIDPLMLQYYPNVTNSAFRGAVLEIRRERTIEMCMEGLRQWDLLRWKEGARFRGPYYGCYFPGPGKYDMDNDGVDDLVLWTGTRVTITGGTSKEIGTDVILSEGTSGYIIAYKDNNLVWNEDRDYLWPIPADERVLSGGVLTQNPGWTDSTNY